MLVGGGCRLGSSDKAIAHILPTVKGHLNLSSRHLLAPSTWEGRSFVQASRMTWLFLVASVGGANDWGRRQGSRLCFGDGWVVCPTCRNAAPGTAQGQRLGPCYLLGADGLQAQFINSVSCG